MKEETTRNRVLKFRALKDDISNCNWIYGNLIYDVDGITPRIQYKNSQIFETCLKGTESQFTGLTDKNGKEIYEGDILRDTKGFGVVYYYQPQFIVQSLPDEDSNDGVFQLGKGVVNLTTLEETEIIGNIHEHPHLLTPLAL